MSTLAYSFVQSVWLQSAKVSWPDHFPSAEEFLRNYHVIVEVVCSSFMQKVFYTFTATNFASNMVFMVVEV